MCQYILLNASMAIVIKTVHMNNWSINSNILNFVILVSSYKDRWITPVCTLEWSLFYSIFLPTVASIWISIWISTAIAIRPATIVAKDTLFNNFVRFAYYTGARSGEIRRISRDNVMEDSLVVRGKTGRRMVKLNSQAIGEEIIHTDFGWWFQCDWS